MKYLKTRARLFPIIAILGFILGSCYSPKLLSQTIKVFSMKIDASKFLDFEKHDILILTFRKELIGSKYLAEGKFSPDSRPKKIRLKKYSASAFTAVYLRVLGLPKDSITKFISDLSSIDSIDLRTHASEYDIIFKTYKETDDSDAYVNYTIQAINKDTQLISTATGRTNPCPPCR
jgi:hypothetical protein